MPLTAIQQAIATDSATQTGTINGVAVKDLPRTGDGAFDAAKWYNLAAAGPFVVWRDLPMETVEGLISYANMTPLDDPPTDTAASDYLARCTLYTARQLVCQGKQFNLQNLKIGRTTAPMKRTGYRASLQDALTNLPAGAAGAKIAANWVGIRDGAKFSATNAEKLLATGTGTTATPADLSFEGTISDADVRAAWGI